MEEKNPNSMASSASPPSTDPATVTDKSGEVNRRQFLGTVGATSAALASGALGISTLMKASEASANSSRGRGHEHDHPHQRVRDFLDSRRDTAKDEADILERVLPHPHNGDEQRYADQQFVGNFSKTLRHDANGLVLPEDYRALLRALRIGTEEAFNQVPSGGTGRLAGPLSVLAFPMCGPDAMGVVMRVPPPIASAETAAEMVELYWEAICRDVPFVQFQSNALVGQAIQDISRLSGYLGPKPVNAQTVFRHTFYGCTDGPPISQILYTTHRFDGVDFVPAIRSRPPVTDPNTGDLLPNGSMDFLTNLEEFVRAENGINTGLANPPVTPPRFVATLRDLAAVGLSDSIYSLYFRASMILSSIGVGSDPANPYVSNTRISGFNTFSTTELNRLIPTVLQSEQHAFFHKWYVHRKLRPEPLGNLVDGIVSGRFNFNPTLHSDVVNSPVLPLIFELNRKQNARRGVGGGRGTFLFPHMSTGGSPSHPAGPGGHAIAAGVGVTLIKAWLDVGTPANPKPWPRPPVEASADGSRLNPVQANLTILGELNKLAANISTARDIAGIHSRVTDGLLGLELGEEVAIQYLNDMGPTLPEKFSGFTLTKFDGTTITVGANI